MCAGVRVSVCVCVWLMSVCVRCWFSVWVLRDVMVVWGLGCRLYGTHLFGSRECKKSNCHLMGLQRIVLDFRKKNPKKFGSGTFFMEFAQSKNALAAQ